MILILVFIVINIFVNALFNRNVDKMSERDMADISQELSTQAKTMNQLVGAFKLKSDTE